MRTIHAWCLAFGGLLPAAAAAEDAEGCRDHPLFNRLPAYDIMDCERQEFGRFAFPLAESASCDGHRSESVEGRRYYVHYGLREGTTPASRLQIQRNYANAVRNAGGSALIESDDWDDGTALCFDGSQYPFASVFRSRSGGREVWSAVVPLFEGEEYALYVVEREAMKQDVVAGELLDAINRDGYVALYLNFDTGKATIRADSQSTLDQVAMMLKSAPALRLEVAGHTDNVGLADANLRLSESRAREVQAALVRRGIAEDRLSAKGYGAGTPLADNRGEEGRAKNRRVELVRR